MKADALSDCKGSRECEACGKDILHPLVWAMIQKDFGPVSWVFLATTGYCFCHDIEGDIQ